MGTLHEDLSTFMVISCWIILRIRNVSDKSFRENQNSHFIFNNFFWKSCCLWDNVENIVELERPQITVWCMCISHWYLRLQTHTFNLIFFWPCIMNWLPTLVHWLLFIHKMLFSSACFEPQVLIFRRIQLYTCSIWYCHSLWEFLVACRYTAWVRTDWRGKSCWWVS